MVRKNTRRRRGWSGWLIGLLVLVPILWIGYWYAAQQIAQAAIERATTRPIAGGRFACTGQSLGGFPLRLDFGCAHAAYTDGPEGSAGRVSAALGGLQASAPLYRPGYVEATLASPFVIDMPPLGIAITTAWSSADTTATAGIDGLKSASATIHSLDFTSTGGTRAVPVKAMTASTAQMNIAPAADNAYRIAAAASDLQVVPLDGRTIPAIDGEATITALDFGASLGNDPGAALFRWLRAGGTARIDHLHLAAGNAVADAEGRLTIAPDGLLSGTLNVRFRNPSAFADLAESIRPGSRNDAAKVLAVMAALTVPVNTPDGPARQTTVVIKNGLVAVGILPVGVIPPLKF